MNELIEILFRNPIIVLLVVSWLVSMAGGFMQRAAKRAQAQQRKQSAGTTPSVTSAAPRSATAGPSARQLDAQKIARDIRANMRRDVPPPNPEPTVERQPLAPPPLRRAVEPAASQSPRLETVERSNQRPKHGRRGNLAEEMAARDAAEKQRDQRQLHLGKLQDRDAHLGDSVSGRHLSGRLEQGRAAPSRAQTQLEARGRRARPSRRLLDLSRPAAGILAMEILGTPVALRDQPGARGPLGR